MSTSDQTLLRAFSEDRALASSALFSHRHTHASPPFHVEIMDLWRCADEFVLIEAFREAAKTTLSEEFLLMEACYGNFFYTVIFAETYAKACQRIEAIAYEAQTNHKLHALFGRVLEKKPIENKIWFRSGALIECVGWEQEITGFKHLNRRPDRAYLDDIENLERVRSTEAVDATMRKLYREVLPAMDKTRRKIRVTETPRAVDCLVSRLCQSPEWVTRSFPICDGAIDDPKTQSAWPERYPMEWIRAEKNRFEEVGQLREFIQEYMLSVESSETKPFSEDMLRSVDVAPHAWLPKYAIYDPARTASLKRSDRTGKVVVSRMGSKIIIHKSGGYFWKPDETRTDIFDENEASRPAEIGVEKNSLDDYLMQPIRFEMIRRGVTLPIRALQAPQDRDKHAFIMGLHPFFKAGDVILVGGRGMHAQLVAEILNFPGGRLDILNALAYCFRMFGGDPVYEDFTEENISAAPPVSGTAYAAWHSNGTDTVCVLATRSGRHTQVVRDYAATGPLLDAARGISLEIRAAYPRARVECYVPAELHDQWQRTPLIPALRELKWSPWRGEHLTVARGCLMELIRTTVRGRRTLTVDKAAARTLAALAGAYRYPVSASGAKALEPEPGIPRLIAEALECLTAVLQKGQDSAQLVGANYATNTTGAKYMTSLPQKGR